MCQKRGRASPIRHHHVPTTPTSDFPNRRKVIKLSLSNALTEFRKKVRYRTRAIISRCLYIFYPIFHCGLYCRVVNITDNLCAKQGEFFNFWA